MFPGGRGGFVDKGRRVALTGQREQRLDPPSVPDLVRKYLRTLSVPDTTREASTKAATAKRVHAGAKLQSIIMDPQNLGFILTYLPNCLVPSVNETSLLFNLCCRSFEQLRVS